MTAAVVGFDCAPTRSLAAALDLPLEAVAQPDVATDGSLAWTFTDSIEQAATAVGRGPTLERAVVCTWRASSTPVPLVELAAQDWLAEVESQLGLWYRVLVAVAERCADSAAIVVVVERPAPIDVENNGAVTTVAEGISTLSRSIALVHGERGVRVNTVGSELQTAPQHLLGLAPALPAFPGDVRGIAGVVRLLLEDAAGAVTGTLVRADYGRSW